MFFWKKAYYLIHNLKSNKKASLRACHKLADPNTCDIINNPKNIKNRISKGTFSLAPSEYPASMCVEASLSFSFFLLFFINILSIIFLFMTYTKDLAILQQQGKKAAAYAYIAEGAVGRNEDLIRLQKNEVVESPFGILKLPACRLHIQCVVKPWTGYDVTGGNYRDKEDTLVYMTEYGTVYHKNRACTHLALSIQAVAFATVENLSNESGEGYVSCESCGKNGLFTVVFITNYGNKYHTTTKCRGLKRSIKTVLLSQLKGVSPCQKCG